jgi:hypothetical protein
VNCNGMASGPRRGIGVLALSMTLWVVACTSSNEARVPKEGLLRHSKAAGWGTILGTVASVQQRNEAHREP